MRTDCVLCWETRTDDGATTRVTGGAVRAELIIEARIATLAGARGPGWAEALAIGGGRVLAAGSRDDVRTLAGPRTRMWRLGRRHVILPGIVDAHLHLLSASLAVHQVDLTGLDREAALAAIARAHERLEAGGRPANQEGRPAWLLGHGWSMADLGGWPDAGMLEAVAPGRAVALWAHDHHSRWVSHEALRRASIGAATSAPAGGRIGLDRDGQPDGMLHEHAAGLVDRAIPAPTHEELAQALAAFAARLARLGVTGVHDPGEISPDPSMTRGPRFYRRLAGEGSLPLRVVASVREAQLPAAIEMGMRTGTGLAGASSAADPAGRPRGDRETLAAQRYRDGWLKLFADGALGSRSAHLLEPYETDDPAGPALGGTRGMAVRTTNELRAATLRAARAGLATQIHAIGDAAVRGALDVLGSVPRPGRAHHRIEHAQLVHPDDVPRFACLGVAASVQPCHLLSDARAASVAWGPRAAHAFPLRDLDTAGALLPMGSDAPVEPADPWPGLAAAVARRAGLRVTPRTSRQVDDEPFHPEQALDVWRALRAACLDGPASLGVTDEGHLAPGARADLLVLETRALAGPFAGNGSDEGVRALATARPLATLLDGELIHRAAAFDPG